MDDPDHERSTSHLPLESVTLPQQRGNVTIAIDVGSSSIRCTAYDCDITDNGKEISSQHPPQQPSFTVLASYSYPRKSIDSYTGNVRIFDTVDNPPLQYSSLDNVTVNPTTTNDIFDCIDTCLDHVLQQLQSQMNNNHKQYNIIGVGFSTFVMNLIGLDHNNAPIGNTATMSYACQRKEVQDEVKRLQSELSPQVRHYLYEATGVPLHTAYAMAQLRVWYQTNNSIVFSAKVYQWSTIASICLHRWCNSCSNATASSKLIPISLSEASWTGLLNFHTGQYETQIIKLLPADCIVALPNIATTCTASLTLNEAYTVRWPILRNSKFFYGVGDGACANIGSKCTSMNRIACTIGTSAAARVCIYYPIQLPQTKQQSHLLEQHPDEPLRSCTGSEEAASIGEDNSNSTLRIPSGLFCYRIDQYHVLIGGALTDGGNVIEWIDNHLLVNTNEATSPSELELAMNDAEQLLNSDYNEYCNFSKNEVTSLPPPTTSSLMVVPFFSGERNTGYRSNATGVMIGLTLQTRSHHIVKACLEGITLRLYAIIQLICDTVTPLLLHQQKHDTDSSTYNMHSNNDTHISNSDELSMMILCSGKALEKNQLWRTMIADCTGLPVYMETQTNEGTSRGVAILMHHALFHKQQEGKGSLNGSLIVEDIIIESDTSHSSDTKNLVTVQQPNKTVKGYWTALFKRQEATIEALSATSHWS